MLQPIFLAPFALCLRMTCLTSSSCRFTFGVIQTMRGTMAALPKVQQMGTVTVDLDDKKKASGSPEDLAALLFAMQRLEREAAQGKPDSATHPPANGGEGNKAPSRKKTTPPRDEQEASATVAEVDQWGALMEKLNPDQMRFLRIIKDQDGIDLDAMTAAMGKATTNAISGYQTPVQRNIRAVGLKEKDVFVRLTKGKGRKKESHFKAGRLLRVCRVPELKEDKETKG